MYKVFISTNNAASAIIFRNSSRRGHRRRVRSTHSTQPGGDTDRRLLLLDAADNVLVATSRIHGGETVLVEDASVTIPADLPIGHKLSRRAIAAGEKIHQVRSAHRLGYRGHC